MLTCSWCSSTDCLAMRVPHCREHESEFIELVVAMTRAQWRARYPRPEWYETIMALYPTEAGPTEWSYP